MCVPGEEVDEADWNGYLSHRAADHDIDDASNTQITVYSGRGLYIESTKGTFWLVGTAVEHHVLYQYQLAGTTNIFAAQLQTETPYFQPLPTALVPFTASTTLQDPTFSCSGVSGNCEEAWGLRILSSSNVAIYGSNHYSWFDNYSQSMFFKKIRPLPPFFFSFFFFLALFSLCASPRPSSACASKLTFRLFSHQTAPLSLLARIASPASSGCRARSATSTSTV